MVNQPPLDWEVKLIRGDYIVAAFTTETKARDYAKLLNQDGRRWKAVKKP